MLSSHSGPAVARAYHRLVALVFLVAFWSLGVQLDVLVGSRGLLPAAELFEALGSRAEPLSWHELPTIFWLDASDAALRTGIGCGLALSVLALFAVPRLCFALLVPLYLSYILVCRDFLSFQWDNMLIECGALALLLPRDRRAPIAHFLFRALLFKLYFESGLAKWQSHLMDWHDGSAMTFYYETAPIPGPLARTFHHLPELLHRIESGLAIGFELFLAPLVFGTRSMRLLALAGFTSFQLINIATANYGFFCYLSLAVSVFLLDEADIHRATRSLRRLRPTAVRRARAHLRRLRVGGLGLLHAHRWRRPVALLLTLPVAAVWLTVSVRDGTERFTRPPAQCARVAPRECISRPPALQAALDAASPLSEAVAPFRLVHVYHLFGHITRERIEPEVQLLLDGQWSAPAMVYKPGPIERRPPLVAPHQPRVDFRLWFYGLSYRRGMPRYVQTLLDRLCHDPEAVQPLFTDPLIQSPEAARLVFYRYTFSPPESPHHWDRQQLGQTRAFACD